MPNFARVLVLAVPSLVLVACGGSSSTDDASTVSDGAAAATGSATLRLRCDGCTAEPITVGPTARCDIYPAGVDSEYELRLEGSGGERLTIGPFVTPATGGRISGDACMVEVVAPGDGTFLGACGPNPPSSDQPCQVQRVRVEGGIELDLRCVGLVDDGQASVTRDLGPATSSDGFVSVSVSRCSGS